MEQSKESGIFFVKQSTLGIADLNKSKENYYFGNLKDDQKHGIGCSV